MLKKRLKKMEKVEIKLKKVGKSCLTTLLNICDLKLIKIKKSGGSQGGWVGGWMDGLKTILRIAYSIQKRKWKKREKEGSR